MKQIGQLFFALLLCCLQAFAAGAQPDIQQKAIGELKKVAAAYQATPYLRFDVLYRYAGQENPFQFLDSLKGSFKLHGGKYWYAFDQTEAVGSTDTTVMLFKEDQVMYLSKPTASVVGLPTAMLDSFLKHQQHIRYGMEEKDGLVILTLAQEASAPLTKVEYWIDQKRHLIQKVRMHAAGAVLLDGVDSREGKVAGPVVIEGIFSNYELRPFDESIFRMDNYFTKQGSELVAVAPYQGYQLFLGSANF